MSLGHARLRETQNLIHIESKIQEWEACPDETEAGNHTLCKLRPLCIARPSQTLIPRGSGHSFHTIDLLCTAHFAPPVGDVGNKGRLHLSSARFSKSPQFHSRDLENLSGMQALPSASLRLNFHFSSLNDGYYCLISLSTLRFPTTRRAAFIVSEKRRSYEVNSPSALFGVHHAGQFPGIQRCTPVFHAQRNAEMNTIKK
jgi:hypothetical protein